VCNRRLAGLCCLPGLSDRALRGSLWWTLIVLVTVFVTYQYVVLMYWPPAATFIKGQWPYTLSESTQYFYLALGRSVQGYQIVPDFIALMMLCITKMMWRDDDLAREQALLTRCAR
jgi:hypothetical protein